MPPVADQTRDSSPPFDARPNSQSIGPNGGDWSRAARKFLLGMCLMLLCLFSLLVLLQRKLIYRPTRGPVTREAVGPAADRLSDVAIRTRDGLSLQGWLVAAKPAPSAQTSPVRRLTIYFQGNASHRGRRGKQFTMLSDLGSEVLIVDYRGYGENPGTPSEQALAADARDIWKYAVDEWRYRPDEIVLFGESLGGGVATGLAHELCREGTPPGGLILRATFSSLVDAASHHYPFLPVNWVLVDRFPSIERVPEITCPLLVLHGDQDAIIPISQGEALHAAAPEKSAAGVPKQFVRLTGAGHNDILYVAAEPMLDALQRFLGSLPAATHGENGQ